ncbi:HEAT repeat domain-containing protein [Schlesneria sp. DSM 10557]|uniref:HEAT repeat domain-containing protein n=1 Tax=Schlesneria sp. DSM 10557 TaxID=3044399 RepID=UPI0035A1B8E7
MAVIPHPFSNQPVTHWIALFSDAESAEERLRALQAIGLLGSAEEVNRLAQQGLTDADSTVRAAAAKLLGTPGPLDAGAAETPLTMLLEDEDPDTRFEAARALVRRKSPQQAKAVQTLFSFLGEEETQPLMVAATVDAVVEADELSASDLERFLPLLESRFETERGEVREAVAAAFVRWPGLCEKVIEKLLPLLDDSEPIVRERTAVALGKAGNSDPRVIEGLETAAKDEDSEVARVAQESLQKLIAK